MKLFICQYCGSERKNSNAKSNHESRCSLNSNKKNVWNKGLTKETSTILSEFAEKCKVTRKNKTHSKETKEKIGKSLKGRSTGFASTPEKEKERRRKISEAAKRNNGGYVKGSGNGKKGWYKGFFCDSSWELAYVIYCLDHSIPIKRNREKRFYEYQGKTKIYIPDFIVSSQLVEIKGFKSDEWEAKLRFNQDVKVLYKADLENVFEYVKTTYGKNFIEMYE
jgi:hypothetical protein